MPYVNGKYYTESEIERIRERLDSDAFDRFLVSGMIGAVTGSALLGGLFGGSFLGGLLGDSLEGNDDSLF